MLKTIRSAFASCRRASSTAPGGIVPMPAASTSVITPSTRERRRRWRSRSATRSLPGSATPLVSMRTCSGAAGPSSRSGQLRHEIGPHRAADASVLERDHVRVAAHDQPAVDVDRAEVVDEHGDPQPVLAREDAVEQRRLARAEEAGEDRQRARAPHASTTRARPRATALGRRFHTTTWYERQR